MLPDSSLYRLSFSKIRIHSFLIIRLCAADRQEPLYKQYQCQLKITFLYQSGRYRVSWFPLRSISTIPALVASICRSPSYRQPSRSYLLSPSCPRLRKCFWSFDCLPVRSNKSSSDPAALQVCFLYCLHSGIDNASFGVNRHFSPAFLPPSSQTMWTHSLESQFYRTSNRLSLSVRQPRFFSSSRTHLCSFSIQASNNRGVRRDHDSITICVSHEIATVKIRSSNQWLLVTELNISNKRRRRICSFFLLDRPRGDHLSVHRRLSSYKPSRSGDPRYDLVLTVDLGCNLSSGVRRIYDGWSAPGRGEWVASITQAIQLHVFFLFAKTILPS